MVYRTKTITPKINPVCISDRVRAMRSDSSKERQLLSHRLYSESYKHNLPLDIVTVRYAPFFL